MSQRDAQHMRHGFEEDDCLSLYMREAMAHPLLTAAQEIELGRAIHAGGDGAQAARDRLICCNLRLVVHVAKRFQRMGLPMEDLVQDGNLGLIRAVDKFDPTRGYRFSTYATWWIRQSIQRGLADTSRMIRVPFYASQEIIRIYQIAHQIEERTGEPPTDAELAEMLGLSVERLRRLRRAASPPLSLDLELGEDGDTALWELVADDRSPAPETVAALAERRQAVEDALVCVTAREERVLRLYYGWDGDQLTMAQIGQRFGVTRQRIQQILVGAVDMVKLLHPELAEWLHP